MRTLIPLSFSLFESDQLQLPLPSRVQPKMELCIAQGSVLFSDPLPQMA